MKDSTIKRKKEHWSANVSINLAYVLIAFCFSWLSPILTSKFTNANFIEPILFFGLVLSWINSYEIRVMGREFLKSKIIIAVFLYMLLCCFVSIYYEFTKLADGYADFRSLLVIFSSMYLLAISKNVVKNEKLISVAIRICILISMMDVLALIYRIYYFDDNQENIKNVISITVPMLAMIFLLRRSSFFMAFIFLLIIVFEAAFGFLRLYYIYMAFALIIYVCFYVRHFFKMGTGLNLFVITMGLFAGLYIIPALYSKIIIYYESDPRRIIHSINRSEDLYNNGLSGESERMGSVLAVLNSPERFVFPHGLGWRSFVKKINLEFYDYSVISSMDSSFFYINYHLGIFFGFIVSVAFAFILLRLFFVNKSTFILSPILRLLLSAVFFLSFFSSSAMLTNPQTAFAFALVFGFAFVR